MNRANPKDLRHAGQVAQHYIKAGILFVPMPVLDRADHEALVAQSTERLEKMAQLSERVEP